MTRRAKGDGSLRFDATRNRWVVVVEAGRRADGSRRRAKRYAKTQTEARKLLRQLQHQQEAGRLAKGVAPTLSDFAEFWLKNEAPSQVRATTADGYAYIIRRYVLPSFGHRRVNAITSPEVVEWMASMGRDGYSTNTIRNARRMLHLLMEHAARHEYLLANPVSRTRAPRIATKKSQVQDPLSKSEARAYLDASLGTEQLELYVHLSILTGMRRGEVLGLWWSDIDFDSQKLHVTRTLKEGTRVQPDGRGLTQPVYNPPKTKKSKREIDLEQPSVAALLRHRTRQREQRLKVGPAWDDRGLVFTNPLGGEVYASSVYQKYVRWVRRSGLRRVRPHDLRHTYATLSLGAGAELEKVSRALGHSSIAITMDLYASHVPGIAKEAMEKVARLLYEPHELGEVVPGAIRAESGSGGSRSNGSGRSRYDRPARWQGDA